MYVLHVTSGREQYILSELRRQKISCCVPMRTALERHGGQWLSADRILLPSYVFLDCDYNAENYYKTKSVDGVIRWLGSPSPLPDYEEKYIQWLRNGDKPIEPSEITIADGKITATAGILMGNEDKILELRKRQKRAVMELTIAGRRHRITLAVDIQGEKNAE